MREYDAKIGSFPISSINLRYKYKPRVGLVVYFKDANRKEKWRKGKIYRIVKSMSGRLQLLFIELT